MSNSLKVLAASALLGAAATVLANGGGAMPAPRPAMPRVETPEQKAHELYNDGVRFVKKADKAQAESDQASDASRKDKAAREAHDRYASSLEKFRQAVELDPRLYEGWNYLGYTSRRLGHYDDALAAYDKALALKPGYPDAIEYRGEAYLAVKRVSDAQQAYLDLFAGDRALADKLLAAMKAWVAAQRANASGSDATGVDELDKWIQERARIAGQTAALTRTGAAASWR